MLFIAKRYSKTDFFPEKKEGILKSQSELEKIESEKLYKDKAF